MGLTRSSLIGCVASLMSGASASITSGKACTPTSATLKMKWNAYASEWGAYTIDGCDGVNPKLTLTAGTTYTLDQSDASNWCATRLRVLRLACPFPPYLNPVRPNMAHCVLVPSHRYHPVGFAYIAGGAHTACKDSTGTLGECPELGGEPAGTTIQYYVDGVAVTSDESTFGLDAYEPLFFNSQDWWGEKNEANAFKVTLTIPGDASYTKIYYFSHIHAGMSAEIDITGSTAATKTELNAFYLGGETEATALAIFTKIQADHQKEILAFDEKCGPGADSKHATCSGKDFLCGDGGDDDYAMCLKAIDCQMHHDMAVSVPSTSTSKFATFIRQMIPHHRNAVAMAKVLTKHHTEKDYPAAGTEDQDMEWAEGLARNIINVQNQQIQERSAWLESNPTLSGASTMCYDDDKLGSKVKTSVGSHKVVAGGRSRAARRAHQPAPR